MKKLSVVSVVGAALLALGSVAYAGPLADATADSLWGIQLGGYLDVSYTYNFNNPDESNDGIGGRAFANDDNQIQLDAFQLYIDKLPTDAGEVGFRFDILAGEDAQAIGDLWNNGWGNDDDISIYQAFISYIAPIGNGLTIDLGRFAASAGYESIESPANDQFSRGLLFTFLQPWTTTGLRLTYAINDQWEITGGLTQGWNVVEDNNEAWTFNGGIRWMPMETVFIQETVYYGPENWNVNNGTIDSNFDGVNDTNRLGNDMYLSEESNDNYTLLSDLVASWDINESWTIGGNFDYINNEDAIDKQDAQLWGLAGYVRYNVNEDLYLAVRGEYIDDSDGILYYNPGWKDNSLWEVTATLGYTITEGLLTRLEYRHDSSDQEIFADDGIDAAGFANADDQQDTIAIEVIYSF